MQKRYPVYHNGRFSNYIGEKPESVFWRSMVMFMQSWFQRRKLTPATHLWSVPAQPLHDATLSWVGHATFLIRMDGITIITDPVFGSISPLFNRIIPASCTLETAPVVDVVLISHNHRDHLDARSIKALHRRNSKVLFLVPAGDAAWFKRHGYRNVREYLWWEHATFERDGQTLTFTFLPAFHWSQRGFFDRNKSLWGSWMIEGSTTVYFAGDTAFDTHFAEISGHFKNISHALMPIAPCEPHEWMKFSHMNAEEAVEAFLALKAQHFVPMHWGAYWFGVDEFTLPIERLVSYWEKQQMLEAKELHLLKVGEAHSLREIEPDSWLIQPESSEDSALI